MERKFPSKIFVFVTAITHNCDNFYCWSQIFHILPSICEGFILSSQIRFFERAFWVRQKFLVANSHFSCSDPYKHKKYPRTCPNAIILESFQSLFLSPSFNLYTMASLPFSPSTCGLGVQSPFSPSLLPFLESSILSWKAACSLFRYHLHINAARRLAGRHLMRR